VVDVAGGRVVLDPPGGLLASDADRLEVAAPATDEPAPREGGPAADDAEGEG